MDRVTIAQVQMAEEMLARVTGKRVVVEYVGPWGVNVYIGDTRQGLATGVTKREAVAYMQTYAEGYRSGMEDLTKQAAA